jgi:hypothetical protein
MGYWKYDQHQSNTNWEADLQSSEMVKDCDMVILETLDKGHIKLVVKKNGIWGYMES